MKAASAVSRSGVLRIDRELMRTAAWSTMASTAPADPATTTETPRWHVLTREDVVHELQVEADQGLSSEEAARRLAEHGPNRFEQAKQESRLHAFLRQYQDPMQIVLVAAGVISI